ncbi:hypothetical protein [Desulfobotulus alkaliphilus]|nr:hypothetical protein [Desulfobotulus alkaliphilus]
MKKTFLNQASPTQGRNSFHRKICIPEMPFRKTKGMSFGNLIIHA